MHAKNTCLILFGRRRSKLKSNTPRSLFSYLIFSIFLFVSSSYLPNSTSLLLSADLPAYYLYSIYLFLFLYPSYYSVSFFLSHFFFLFDCLFVSFLFLFFLSLFAVVFSWLPTFLFSFIFFIAFLFYLFLVISFFSLFVSDLGYYMSSTTKTSTGNTDGIAELISPKYVILTN